MIRKITFPILLVFMAFSFTEKSQAQVKYENLGPNVNTYADEIGPVISADGTLLFFCRYNYEQNWAGTGRHDAYLSTRNTDGTWSKAIHLGKPINASDHSGSVENISADNNQIIIRGAYEDGEFVGGGFSLLVKNKKGEFDDPVKLDIKNYKQYSKGSYTNLYLCKDGKTLLIYFSETAKNENGDLYVSFLVEKEKWKKGGGLKSLGSFINKALLNNTWTEPKKIGNINTPDYDETTPFLASDGVTLYFSSNRPGGQGSNDIWMAKRLDDTWTNWSEPVNLGPTVNSKEWDAYYTLDAKGEYAYMVSSEKSYGKGDIVKIKLQEELRPQPVVLISGKVFNAKTKEPIGANIEYENLVTAKNAGVAISNSSTGEYKIVLPYGVNYGFMAYNSGFYSVSDNLDLTNVAEYKEITRDLYLAPIEVGQVIRLNNIFFDFGKSSLRNESFPELDRLVGFMNQNEKMQIELGGHTDNVGSSEANKKLSNDRVTTVKEYLVSKGINADRIQAKGYGEEKPVASNDTDEGKQLNRRVEFTILKK